MQTCTVRLHSYRFQKLIHKELTFFNIYLNPFKSHIPISHPPLANGGWEISLSNAQQFCASGAKCLLLIGGANDD